MVSIDLSVSRLGEALEPEIGTPAHVLSAVYSTESKRDVAQFDPAGRIFQGTVAVTLEYNAPTLHSRDNHAG
jgi:hypothetical protein